MSVDHEFDLLNASESSVRASRRVTKELKVWGGSLAVLAATWISAGVGYLVAPEMVPIHWNIHGQADGFGSPAALFLTPAIATAMLGVFAVMPWISPRPFQVNDFRSTFLDVVGLMTGLFAAIHALILAATFEAPIDVGRWLVGVMMVFFILIGNILGRVRRNFYIGIRTPWTIANERVWNDTHRFGGKVFVLTGVVGLGAILLGAPVWGIFVMALIAALGPVVYSFARYRQLERLGELDGDHAAA
ncbi:protein of unknown function DUF1648 [Isosphaera pallida ATCC 43644]|uniref:DUF1648 domain-containing protein n=1 Tax=Isosphaera pallida (strain ATCC 43644 / DSM 9630 / IS1B) TaxID=575540 RepID=E8R4L5_ISOPI|nr:SdpI family protein [Isosphaera pallida]ADV60606.1 protein of unknown function DUF1648 [Isosphaera pallida ATCC 43644]